MMKKLSVQALTVIALSVALNYVGATIALFLKLPIYLDSIGTVFAGAFLGPIAGMLAGFISGLISGLTTDLFALYYLPVALVTGCMAGLLLHKQHRFRWLPLQSLAIALPGTVLSTTITTVFFNGITSSGSSLLVQVLYGLGLSKFASVLIIQVITDYGDRLLSVILATAAITALARRRQIQVAKKSKLP